MHTAHIALSIEFASTTALAAPFSFERRKKAMCLPFKCARRLNLWQWRQSGAHSHTHTHIRNRFLAIAQRLTMILMNFYRVSNAVTLFPTLDLMALLCSRFFCRLCVNSTRQRKRKTKTKTKTKEMYKKDQRLAASFLSLILFAIRRLRSSTATANNLILWVHAFVSG